MTNLPFKKLQDRLQLAEQQTSAQRDFIPCEQISETKVLRAGKELLSFANSDFFNISKHPDVAKAFMSSFNQHGFGYASSRLAAGSHQLHLLAEQRLATFLGCEAALLVSSRSQACISLLSVIANESDLIIFSEETESPLSDIAYLLGCQCLPYQKDNFQKIFTNQLSANGLKILIVDSSNFPQDQQQELQKLANTQVSAACDLILFDETLTLGALGLRGAGMPEVLATLPNSSLIYGDLGTMFPIAAGFIAGPQVIIKQIQKRSRVLNLERAATLPTLSALVAAIDLIEQLPNQRLLLADRTTTLFNDLKSLCTFAKIEQLQAPGLKLIFDNDKAARAAQQALIERGILLDCINYSGVKSRHSQLRIFLNSQHQQADLARLLESIEKLSKR